jgi:PAS domain S-box-containing protein
VSEAPPTAAILLVDDRAENLLVLEAILEPLGQELVRAHSGEEALRLLLRRDFAVILLDVQMPGIDGFETARLIKERQRTRHIPILFLTAISRDSDQVFRGYSAGAVDYILKPFDTDVLRSKVGVFVELWQKGELLRRQEVELRQREVAEAVFESEARYRTLAEAMPQIVWLADQGGRATYYNQQWFEYTGLDAEHVSGQEWHAIVHPDELPETIVRFQRAASAAGVFEMEYRLRRSDGRYRWHLATSAPRPTSTTSAAHATRSGSSWRRGTSSARRSTTGRRCRRSPAPRSPPSPTGRPCTSSATTARSSGSRSRTSTRRS